MALARWAPLNSNQKLKANEVNRGVIQSALSGLNDVFGAVKSSSSPRSQRIVDAEISQFHLRLINSVLSFLINISEFFLCSSSSRSQNTTETHNE